MEMISPLARVSSKRRTSGTKQKRIVRVVVHITGMQTYLNAKKAKEAPLARLEDYFTTPDVGARYQTFSHYGVDPWGQIVCFADETLRPRSQSWSALGGRAGVAARRPPDWWLDKWQKPPYGFTRVTDMIREATPNQDAASIEFIQYGGQPCLTMAQYDAGHNLINDICRRNGFVMNERNVLGHEDVDPWGRGNAGGGWDPGARRVQLTFDWNRIFGASVETTEGVIPTPVQQEWERYKR